MEKILGYCLREKICIPGVMENRKKNILVYLILGP